MSDNNSFSIQTLLLYRLYHISTIHERIVYTRNMPRLAGVTLIEWRVMGNIASGVNTFTDLASELILDRGQLSKLVKGLQKKQLIEKVKSPQDARKSVLKLSAEGEERKTLIVDMAKQYEAVILNGLSEEQRQGFEQAMQIIEGNMREYWHDKDD